MQRRSFLRNAACVGACASLFAPIERVFAADASAATRAVELTLECVEVGPRADAAVPMQVRVAPRLLVDLDESVRVRAWFATDEGVRAFDLASFGRNGASQRLRFTSETRRLIGFELGHGQQFDDCSAITACRALDDTGAALGPGRYRLSLHRAGAAIATVDLDVSVASA